MERPLTLREFVPLQLRVYAFRSGAKPGCFMNCGSSAYLILTQLRLNWEEQILDGAITKSPLGGKKSERIH